MDGTWIGGRFTEASYASSFPQPRELFIGEQYQMGEDGTFGVPVEGTDGVYVRCDDVRLVEFVRPQPVTSHPARGTLRRAGQET